MKIRIEGADTAADMLRQFEFKIRRRIVTAAVRAGCGEIRKEARAQAPTDTGLMRRQISVSVKMEGVSGKIVGTVKPKRTKAQRKKGMAHQGRVVHLVVGGTAPHEIRAGKNSALAVGGAVYSKIDHPGARPQPFLDRAANSAMPAAIRAFTAKLDERVLKEAAKLRAQQRAKT